MNTITKILTIPAATGLMLGAGLMAGSAMADTPASHKAPAAKYTASASTVDNKCVTGDTPPVVADGTSNPPLVGVDANVSVGSQGTQPHKGNSGGSLVDVKANVNAGTGSSGSHTTTPAAPTTTAPAPSSGGGTTPPPASGGGTTTPPASGGGSHTSQHAPLINVDAGLGLLNKNAVPDSDNQQGRLINVDVLGNLLTGK